ncbi:hypothetical protein ACOSQ2_017059 [Xanthoceras sorbifolium]
MGQHISEPSFRSLENCFTAEEIRIALFQMAPSKAPRVDGFTAGFFQKYWSVVDPGVTLACFNILNEGQFMDLITKTLIVLIQKVDKAARMNEFSTISLCNVIYKKSPSPAACPYGMCLLWVPPLVSLVKLNMDASVDVGSGVIGLGLIFRDDTGRPLMASAVRSGSSSFLVESDVLGVINTISSNLLPCSDMGLVLSDIYCLASSLQVSSFSFIPILANKVANALAKVALNIPSDLFWIDSCPPSVELLVQEDVPE